MEETVRKGISGSTLKIIGMITMVMDHIAAVLIERYLRQSNTPGFDPSDLTKIFSCHDPYAIMYWIMRLIGRIAFPIYCFLLVEGFHKTKSVLKYALRLFLFALITEVPFDLAFRSKWFTLRYQNVFWTLLIGLLTLILMDLIRVHLEGSVAMILRTLTACAGMGLAYLLKTDYNATGVLTIVLMYLFGYDRVLGTAVGCGALLLNHSAECTSFLVIPFIAKYNGKRGVRAKYIFYAFYPLHFMILDLIAYHTGLLKL